MDRMINAKRELIEAINDRTVLIGKIYYKSGYKMPKKVWEFLSHEDYLLKRDELDFEYDSGYGGHHLYGLIVFTDKSWIDRGEYDGSEWWENHKLPSKKDVLSYNPWL